MKSRVLRPNAAHRSAPFLLLIPVLAALILPFFAAPNGGAQAASTFADSAFSQLWTLLDAPVASGQVRRSWYWGPQPGEALQEPYSGSKSGTRLVQYFDKARMEINNPTGDRKSEWFVTTGLLVAEMVSGKRQVGDKEYRSEQPAEIAVGGDGLDVDPSAPTYASFKPVASLRGPGDNRAPSRVGQPVTSTIGREGVAEAEPALGLYPGTKIAAYSSVLGHNIPQVMWDFLNAKGTLRRDGANIEGQSLGNWVFVMGYPITEPYWARVKIEGVYADALFQMYERRTLAYVPSMPRGWQVQMGNVGIHYYRWAYGGALPGAPTPTATAAPVPPSVDATINPASGRVGTPFSVSIRGMRGGESVASWFTAPDGSVTGAPYSLNAGADGAITNIAISTVGLRPGQWAVTYHGKASGHESIVYFLLVEENTNTATAVATYTTTPVSTPSGTVTATHGTTATPTRTALPRGSATATPTFVPVPTQPAGGLVLSVQPGYGPPNAQFTFSARGLGSNEGVQVRFTDPTGGVVYPSGSNNGRYIAGSDGRLQFSLQPDQSFPSAPLGTWLFEVRGLSSGLEGVVGFTLR